MNSEVSKPRGPLFYFCIQYAHRLQSIQARRALKGRDPWESGLRILAYHRVSTDRDPQAVTPTMFRKQMEALLRQARPIHLDEALGVLENRPTGRYVCLTFDDGYHDVLDHAIPVLRDLQIPATFFVSSEIADGTARYYWYEEPPQALSWSELCEMNEDELFTIGAHTRTHPALPNLPDDAAWEEIAGSKLDIEQRTGSAVKTFAYPAGLYGEREVGMVRKAGYSIGVTIEPGLNAPGHRAQTFHRSTIDHRDNLRMFEAKLTGLLDDPWGWRDALGLWDRLRRPRAPDS
jgi:peptidoglycan/xylan/chitin deacetylase (PgdA/CDA1 family)